MHISFFCSSELYNIIAFISLRINIKVYILLKKSRGGKRNEMPKMKNSKISSKLADVIDISQF